MKKLCLTLSCLPLSLALVACGGGDSSGEEAQITTVIEKVLSNPEPADCRELQTQRYLEQTKRSSGKTALEYCEEEAEGDSGESVEVSGASIDGSTATARATYVEGPLSGASLVFELRNAGERWKLDRAIRFVNFDKQKVIEAVSGSIAESGTGSPKLSACISSRLARVPEEELENSFISAPELEVLLLGALQSCARSAG